MQDRFQKELNNAQVSSQDASPQFLMESLLEETQVFTFSNK